MSENTNQENEIISVVKGFTEEVKTNLDKKAGKDELALITKSLTETKEALSKELETISKSHADIQTALARGSFSQNSDDEALKKHDIEVKKFFRDISGHKNINILAKSVYDEVKNDEVAIKKAFDGMNYGDPAMGGYFVRPALDTFISRVLRETSPMRTISRIVQINTLQLDVNLVDNFANADWTSEIGTVGNGMPASIAPFFQKSIQCHNLAGYYVATRQLIEDGVINIENELLQQAGSAIALKQNTAFVKGDGVGKPKGFTTYPAWAASGVYERNKLERISTVSTGAISGDDIINLINSLKPSYTTGAVLVMHRTVWAEVQKLKDANGQYLVGVGTADNAVVNGSTTNTYRNTLRGIPVVLMEDMDYDFGTAGTDIMAYGNFNLGYTIVERTALGVLRDPYTMSNQLSVKFTLNQRVGGDVVNFDCIKLLAMA